MGRFDALTQLDDTPEKTSPAPAVPSPKPPKKKAVTQERGTTTPPVSHHIESEVSNTQQASSLESKPDRLQASNHASMLAISLETIESIRKIVKNPGKQEVLYIRVSKEEKDALEDITYTYKRQSIKTSDNEITRVAINTLLADYKINGANSLLAVLLKSLHD